MQNPKILFSRSISFLLNNNGKTKKNFKINKLYLSFLLVFITAFYFNLPWNGDKLLLVNSSFPNEQIVQHYAYNLQYSEEDEQARWVSYLLTSENARGNISRENNFREDPNILTGSAKLNDYARSGFDRGHLAPAGDMAWSKIAMSESFFLSNMSPQNPSFNRGIWKKLETFVRKSAVSYEKIYVITGPVLNNPLGTVGNGVTIPNSYFKVLLDYSKPDIKAIGFIIPNSKSTQHLSNFSCSVDLVENKTNLDFFASLPDSIEQFLESQANFNEWENLKETQVNMNNKSQVAVQCLGKTQKGFRCKRTTKNENGFCFQHQNQVGTNPIYRK